MPGSHAWPHIPQLSLLFSGSTQLSPHSISFVAQLWLATSPHAAHASRTSTNPLILLILSPEGPDRRTIHRAIRTFDVRAGSLVTILFRRKTEAYSRNTST